MAGETPAVTETPAPSEGAAPDLLEVAAPAEAGKPAPEGAAPQETKAAPAATSESKPDAKASGEDGGEAKSEEDAPDLLADDDEGKTPDKADGQTDAKKDEAPEAYEAFKLPEGVTIDEAALAQATPIFKDLGLTQDKAQKLVDVYAQLQAKAAEQQIAGFTQLKKDWAAEIKADKEFGGDKLTQTTGAVKSLVLKYAGKEFLSELREWGMGNNPRFIRMLARINADLSPDTLVLADQTAQPSAPKKPWEVVYGDSMKPKE